jgi:WD40 repeat protein
LAEIGNGRIDSITWLPDGETFAVGSSKGVHLYDSETLEQIHSIQDSQIGGSVHLRYSPSGSFLLITKGGYETDRVTLWEANSGLLLRDLYDAFYTNFSPDGMIVYFEWTSQQLIWQDLTSGETRQTLPLPFSPRAFSIASGTIVELYLVKTLRLYEMDDLSLRPTLELPDIVDDVAFSPEGNLIAVTSRDGAIRLWDVHSGVLQHTFTGQLDWVSTIQFSPDGRLLAT